MKWLHSLVTRGWAFGCMVIASRCGNCHRSLASKRLLSRQAGIRMGGCWYCNSRCFQSAAEAELSQLLASGHEHANHVSRMPLGLILIDRGLLTSEQLKEAICEQKEVGGEIGELLVRQGLVSEKQVAAVRATQWGCPLFAAENHAVQTQVHIPPTLIQTYSVIPIHHVAATNLLLVGFVHGIEYGLLCAVERMTGCKTEPCFVTPSDFQLQIQQRNQLLERLGDAAPQEVTFEEFPTPAEMARILCDYEVDLDAEEAIIGKCKDYLWARLKCGPKTVDLLFKTA